MKSKHHQARPVVLRELSLLRALGASLRTTKRRPGGRTQPSDAFALLPRHDRPLVAPTPKDHLDEVRKLKRYADRARLFSVLGSIKGATGNWEASAEAHQEALSMASELSDPRLIARVFGERSVVNYEFLRLREAADDAAQSCGSETTLWGRVIQLQILYQTLLLLGRMGKAAKVRDEAEALATRIGQSYSIARILIAKGWVEFGASPDLAKFASTLEEVFKSEPRIPTMFWDVFANAQLSFVNFFRGDWSTALSHAHASTKAREDTFVGGFAAGTLFRQLAYAGDRDAALAILDQKRAWLPRG